jgi:hypothetical protein
MQKQVFTWCMLLGAILFLSNANPQTKNKEIKDNVFRTSSGTIVKIFKDESQLNSIVKASIKRTFGTSSLFELSRIESMELNHSVLVSTVFYKTTLGQSTLLVVTYLTTMTKVVVDCTGTCDCRERLTIKPDGTEIYECTCNECKMTKETIPN